MVHRTKSFKRALLLLLGLSFLTSGLTCIPPNAVLLIGGAGASVLDSGKLTSALSINNIGTAAAENVSVTEIKLDGATLTSPAELPHNLGRIPTDGSAVLDMGFTGQAPFVPGESHTLTVQGSYAVGLATFSFTLTHDFIVAPTAPGTDGAKTVMIESSKVSGAPFPSQPLGFGPQVNAPLWTVPTAPFVRGTPTPTGTEMLQAPDAGQGGKVVNGNQQASPSVIFNANIGLGLTSGTTNGTASTTAEPSGASNAAGVIFATANWIAAYSQDGGGSFTELDPTTVFPADAVGFCCDQIVQYVPSIDRFIWLLQGNGYRLASASPADIVSSGGSAWTYWNLTPNVFGSCGGFDYPDMAVGNNFLYLSWDAGFGGCTSGFQVARIRLDQIQASGTITIGFTNPANGTMAWGSHVSQNTFDEIFWAGHNNNQEMRVFSWAEGSNSYFWRDVGIASWANNTPTSLTPDGQDWLAKNFNGPGGNSFPRNGVIGATRSGNNVWFAWTAGTDDNFQRAHVEMVTLDRSSSFSVVQQVQIWNNSFAFAYPALATLACNGEIGLSLEFGGNGNYENHVVGFWGDFLVYITTGSDVGTARYGDYVTIRREPATADNPGNLFDAFGYGLNSVPPPGAGTQVDVHYVLFGRPRSACNVVD